MRWPALTVAATATVALTAASLTAVALTQASSRSGQTGATGPVRAPVAAAACQVPTSLPGTPVSVMLADMGPGMMGDRPRMGGWGGWDGRDGSSMMSGRWMMMRASPQTVPSGTVSLVAYNHGGRPHELVVLPLSDGASVGARPVGADQRVDESGSLGEASTSCGIGAGDGIATGAVGWVTLTLKPGRYELVCNLPGHYAAGMATELDFT